MKKKAYDVAVIGAGHNGLICAAYLAKAGLKVILLERRHETGGGLDTLEHAGFKFNTHAIYHLMAEIMPVYKDFALHEMSVKYIYPEVQAAYLCAGKKPLLFYKNPEKTAQYITSVFSSKAGESYLKMYLDFKEFSEKILIPLTYVPAVPALDMVQQLNAAKDPIGKKFNQIAELTPLEILESYSIEEPVKAGVLNLFTMWGLSPFEAIGYLFPLYVYRMTNAALCAGGSHRLSSALHKRVVQSGGVISDMSEVVKVIMNAGRVDGVLLADGTEIKANAVVSTVDPRQSFLKFFDEPDIPRHLADSARRWEWEKTTFYGVHLALKQAPAYPLADSIPDAQNALITFLGIENTDQILDHVEDLEAGKLPEHPLGHVTCTSLFDPIQAFKGFHTGRWESLAPFKCDWEKIKESYADRCIAAWKKYAPDIDPLFRLVYPPTYIEHKITNMVQGSFKHGGYIPLQMGYFRPNESCSQVFTPIDGFYVCGASTYPGGMILGGGGYIGANILAEEFGVDKKWEEPEMIKQARNNGIIPE
ncbi:MAG: NAD(P)/FAD-dependent oxidoreductase [Desulfobacterales bacterium]|jgi:phytoene dehydrogenase-like protein|nr:NAD(P)/FAD-dependent oxidoreductase [Desulfobacterales bacterium]